MKQKNIARRYLNLLVVAALAILMIAGCGGSREAGLTGNWKIDPAAMSGALDSASKGATTPQQKAGMEMAKQMLGNATLELKQDKTFTMSMGFPMEGTWAFNDAASSVSLTMTKMMGMDISKIPNAGSASKQPMVCSLSADGKQLTLQDKTGKVAPAAGAMVFVKQ